MIWKPVEGRADLEKSEDGRYRRIPVVGRGKLARPHPTKRIVLTAEEVAALLRQQAEPSKPQKPPKGQR